jgi:hypothetical protein
MSRTLPWFLCVVALGAGCLPSGVDVYLVCRDDTDCSEGLVCYPDGCGDPGSNIVAEVTINPSSGLEAQDLPVGELRSPLTLALEGPTLVHGRVLRESNLSDAPQAYTSEILLSAQGSSQLLPGRPRNFGGKLTPVEGSYQLAVGSGEFTFSLLSKDPTVPPLTAVRTVATGAKAQLDFLIPAAHTLTRLEGQIVRYGQVPVGVDLNVEAVAIDKEKRLPVPLSQVVRVPRSDNGRFTLFLSPQAATQEFLYLRVSAMDADTLVPLKEFTLSPGQPLTEPLELGDYGEPVEVSGQVVDVRGQPLARVAVRLEGTVNGGGRFFTPQVVRTDDAGRFTLRTLPSAPGQEMRLYAQPLPGVRSGLARMSVSIPRGRSTSLPRVVCPDRIQLTGTLLMPFHGKPADMRVQAVPMEPVTGWPLPEHGQPTVSTDAEGDFQLMVDPGRYRLDFLPNTADLTRASRYITVEPAARMDSPPPMELGTFILSNNREVSGTVVLAGQPQAEASVRFFRVGDVQGKPISILLGEGFTDASGRYKVLLPIR